MDWIWLILIGAAAGFFAGVVLRGHGFGLLGNTVVGVIGALLGKLLFTLLGIATVSPIGNLLSAFIGALVFLSLIRFMRHRGA
jgi:uncharacterized membrane protein YeaQ/YmgE (transglycosylase-associated protein family)